MAISIPVSDVCPAAQAPRPTILGSAVSDNIASYVSGNHPDAITHLPEGGALDVPAGGVVSVMGTLSPRQEPTWNVYHFLETGRVQGPALVHVDTARAYLARTGETISASLVRRRRLIQQAVLVLVLSVMAAILNVIAMYAPTPMPIPDYKTQPMGYTFHVYNENLTGIGQGMAPLLIIVAAGLMVLTVMKMIAIVFQPIHAARTLAVPYNNPAARALGITDRLARSQHDTRMPSQPTQPPHHK